MEAIQILTALASSSIMFGVFYGMTNARLKHLEKQIETNKDLSERLARIEEKTTLIIKFFQHEKNIN